MDALDKLLGIDPDTETTEALAVAEETAVDTPPPTVEVIDADTPKTEKELEDDFQHARKNIREMMKTVGGALDSAVVLAQSADAPRAYEVVGKLLEGLVNANKELVELHRTKKDTLTPNKTKQSLLPTGGNSSGGTVNIDKAVFVGRASDLLRTIKEQEKQLKDAEVNASKP